MEADRRRWFPELDEQGNIMPRTPPRLESVKPPPLPKSSAEQPSETVPDEVAREYPIPGQPYVIHAGDSLASIAHAANVFGHLITARAILEANPGLNASRLLVGQKILIPGGKPTGDTAPAPDGSTPAPGKESAPDATTVPAPGQQPPAEPEA
jgi:LysM repeat protein